MDSSNGIRATTISLTVLNYISNEGSSTLTEISTELDIANSTAHEHLKTLTNHRLLVKCGREYHLGIRLFHFGERARTYDTAYNFAHQTVQDLTQTTKNEADFLVEDGGRMLSLYDVVDTTNVSDFTVGKYYHMHSTATGKAILASYSDEKVHEIIDEWGLPAQTESTITNRDELFSELAKIRDCDYAVNEQETTEGLYSVGTVVRDPDRSVLGAISVGGPTYRLNEDTISKAVRSLQDAVKLLESRIENIRL